MCDLTVVIPLYNKEELIRKCIESVVEQTVPPYEVILIDDGSTDESLMRAEAVLVSSTLNYRIIEQENAGVSVARNRGVRIAATKFIAFLDADDQWYPDFIRKFHLLHKEYSEACLYCFRHEIYDQSLGLIQTKNVLTDNFKGYLDDFFLASLKGSVANSSKVVVRKKSIEEIGGFPESAVVSEDLFVWILLALNGRVAYDDYIATRVNQFNDNSRKSRLGEIPYPLIYFSSKKEYGLLTKNAKKYLWRIYFYQVIGSLANGDRKETLRKINAGRKIFVIRSLFLIGFLFLPARLFLIIRKFKRLKYRVVNDFNTIKR